MPRARLDDAFDFDEEDDDFGEAAVVDDWQDEEPPCLHCGRPSLEGCCACGIALCPMCFEVDGGYCGRPACDPSASEESSHAPRTP